MPGGRPKKLQSANTVSNTSTDSSLQELILKLMKEVEELKKEKTVETNIVKVDKNESYFTPEDEDDFDKVDISSDSYIKIMSLTPYQLNLSTKGMGKGKIYTFQEAFQVKRIRYGDLVDIIETHPNFLKDFLFIILDKRVVRRHGLDELYSRVLTKEKIEEILTVDSNETISLFKSAGKRQQEIIVQMLVDKIVNGESLDLNLIDKISRASGVDIQKKANDVIFVLKKE